MHKEARRWSKKMILTIRMTWRKVGRVVESRTRRNYSWMLMSSLWWLYSRSLLSLAPTPVDENKKEEWTTCPEWLSLHRDMVAVVGRTMRRGNRSPDMLWRLPQLYKSLTQCHDTAPRVAGCGAARYRKAPDSVWKKSYIDNASPEPTNQTRQ